MRRLQRRASTNLMHGTSGAFYAQIKATGLMGRANSGNDVTSKSNYKSVWYTHSPSLDSTGVYLTDDEDTAGEYAKRAVTFYGGEPLIIHVNVDPNLLLPDDDAAEMADEDEYDIYELTGADSLAIIHAAIYPQAIPPEQITYMEWPHSYDSPEESLEKIKDLLETISSDLEYDYPPIKDIEWEVDDYNKIIDRLNDMLSENLDLKLSVQVDPLTLSANGQDYTQDIGRLNDELAAAVYKTT